MLSRIHDGEYSFQSLLRKVQNWAWLTGFTVTYIARATCTLWTCKIRKGQSLIEKTFSQVHVAGASP